MPESLASRCQWIVPPAGTATPGSGQSRHAEHADGEFVLYWMHNGLRTHDNPALDVAISWARQNGLPLLVYHGLSEKYPFASDRHHAFIMQAAREVQRELADLGISYAFHLERPGHRGPHLRDLTRRAAVLVTELMPLPPLTCWLERLQSLTSTPIVTVDTSCLLPESHLNDIERSVNFDVFSRPSAYQKATASAYAEILQQPYPQLIDDPAAPLGSLRYDGPLQFQPIDLQDLSIAEAIRSCQIDHTIAPVSDTRGGSRPGYQRWEHFLGESLARYATRRTNAADPHGVSRLSAYLHYGMISPWRIARKAAELSTSSDPVAANKFLYEFLVWREMSFHFCGRHVERLDSLSALPQWAQETLIQHAGDPRERTFAWETLARAKTHEPFWNAAQRSLIKHGELHNNARMTWGKAFLAMTDTPERALHHCIDLNHRYALDGRSPSSYGGILWCFGQFDRPHEPETPIFGAIRPRSVTQHAARIDEEAYGLWVDRPIALSPPRIAIIGAGIAGLVAGRTWADHGLDVCLFEKSRGPGGRLATRRGDGSLQFDHGAQYFTIRNDVFARHVRSWMDMGLVQPWMGRIVALSDAGKSIEPKRGTARYVGIPGNNAIAKHLAEDLEIVTQTRVAQLQRDGGRWKLRDDDDGLLGTFDVVVVNAPPPQASDLLRDHVAWANRIDQVHMSPCWSVMLQADGVNELPYEGAFINEGPLSWIARNDTKPGRVAPGDAKLESSDRANWMLHASAEWTIEHLQRPPETVGPLLVDAFAKATGASIGTIRHCVAHRWRYSVADNPLDDGCLWDPALGLGACGDWCAGSRVEGAFVSGTAMAGALLRHITIDRAPGRVDAKPLASMTS
ncbi:MAG: FAD-dependent oxidoreductase [Planctomycetota bacterium]